MDVTTLVKDWVLSVNGTLDNSLTAFQDALLVLWSVAMRRWDLFLEFFLTTLPLNISLLFDFVLEEFYILYSASATTLSLTLQETLSRLETTNELIQKVALQWTQSFLNALQMAISKIDFQVCVLLVLCLNLGLLAFMVFQKVCAFFAASCIHELMMHCNT